MKSFLLRDIVLFWFMTYVCYYNKFIQIKTHNFFMLLPFSKKNYTRAGVSNYYKKGYFLVNVFMQRK